MKIIFLIKESENIKFDFYIKFIFFIKILINPKFSDNGDSIECCDSEYFNLRPRYRHPSCEPLESVNPRKDTIDRQNCLNFVRSSLAVDKNCRLGVATQLNQASSELDLSQLYGYTKDSQNRMKSKGFLKSDGDFLPYAENHNEFCVSDTEKCYMAGDSRVNSNPYTILLYTIFLRNHNQIAKKLMNENSILSSEEIFEKAKELNIKAYRQIVFNEWLPILIGAGNMDKMANEKLAKQNVEDLEVSNEFGVAAARFYYSMIPSTQIISKSGAHLDLNEEFYTSKLVDRNFDDQIEGILNQKALAMDSTYSHSVSNYLLYKNIKK